MVTKKLIKTLFLSANPRGTDPLRLGEEEREIRAALNLSPNREQFEFIPATAVRVEDLRRALLKYNPQIVHFSGHGAGQPGLVLENDDGKVQLVSTEALAGLFGVFQKDIECVLLNACYSDFQAEAIHQHINCVIGMNQAIGDRAAIQFATGFYDALGAGRSYTDAFKLGCNAIDLANIPESLTPVLKIREAIAPLSHKPDEESAETEHQKHQETDASVIRQNAGAHAKQVGQIINAQNISF